uniref:C2H2-type domain-containing protein n=1 Tax=Bracon brevicornis TaxID=1563983 RepID=A0A6V7HQJ6_9HYME
MAYPKYKNGLEITSADPKDFACFICPKKPGESVDQHLSQKVHTQTLIYFLHYFEDNGSSVVCKICKTSLQIDIIGRHARAHKLVPWYRYKNEVEMLFKNMTSFRKQQYYCHVCSVKSFYRFTAISHTETNDHKSNLSTVNKESLVVNSVGSDSLYRYAIEHVIFRDAKSLAFRCYLCKCDVEPSLSSFIKHARGNEHVQNEKQFDNLVLSAKTFEFLLNEMTPKKIEINSADELEIVSTRCTICNVELNIDDLKLHADFHEENPYKKTTIGVKTKLLPIDVEIVDVTSDDDVEISEAPKINEDRKSTVTLVDVKKESEESVISVTDTTKSGGDLLGLPELVGQAWRNCSLVPESKARESTDNGNIRSPTRETMKSGDNIQLAHSKIVRGNIASTSTTCDGNRDICNMPISCYRYDERKHVIYCNTCGTGIQGYKNFANHANTERHKLFADASNGIRWFEKFGSICDICRCVIGKKMRKIPEHLGSSEHQNGKAKVNREWALVNKIMEKSSVNGEFTSIPLPLYNSSASVKNENNNSISPTNDTPKSGDSNRSVTTEVVCNYSGTCTTHERNQDYCNKKPLPDGYRRKGKFIYCKICNEAIGGKYSNIGIHADVEMHKLLTDAANGLQWISRKRIKCTICDLIMGQRTKKIRKHLNGTLHKEALEKRSRASELVNETVTYPDVDGAITPMPSNAELSIKKQLSAIFESIRGTSTTSIDDNVVTKAFKPVKITFVKCTICDWVILNNPDTITRHINDEDHKVRLRSLSPNSYSRRVIIEPIFTPYKTANYLMIEPTVESDRNLIKVSMTPLYDPESVGKEFYWCNLCDSKLFDPPAVHLRDESHLQLLHGIKHVVGSQYLTCVTCNYSSIIAPTGMIEHINDSIHQTNVAEPCREASNFKSIDFESIQRYLPRSSLPDGIETIVGENSFLCTLCNCILDNITDMHQHTSDGAHSTQIMKNCILKIRDTTLICLVCLSIHRSLKTLKKHLSSSLHVMKCKYIGVLNTENIVTQLLEPIEMIKMRKYTCHLCNVRIGGDSMITLEHALSRRHKELIQKRQNVEMPVQPQATSVNNDSRDFLESAPAGHRADCIKIERDVGITQ